MKVSKFYVDINRKHKKIENNWNECLRLRKEIGGLNFKSFPSFAEAEKYLKGTTGSVLEMKEQTEIKARGAKLELLQGMVRYKEKNPKANQFEYELKTIEKWKLERIQNFTLHIPQKKEMHAVCRKIENYGERKKIARIFAVNEKVKLEYFINTSDLKVSNESFGYLEIELFGIQLYYDFFVKSMPDYSDFDGVCVFVDGSSHEVRTDNEKELVEYAGTNYCPYGGAYQFYRKNEKEAFLSSAYIDENGNLIDCIENSISKGVKGISVHSGNVYAEMNPTMEAIEKADQLGIEKLRIYYDCEQIGGNAPGGAYNQNKKNVKKITKKYIEFWKGLEFKNLKYIELIHVDAHTENSNTEKNLNDVIDELAKAVRDSVRVEFERNKEKQKEYIAHLNDYS